MADRPHFALPFRFEDRGDGILAVVVTEQDSSAEVADCVETAIRTTAGQRTALPEFGRPQTLEFSTDPGFARAQLAQALELAEPRAVPIIAAETDPYDEGQLRLRTMFSYEQEGEE